MRKITFFNHFHNGDIHLSRSMVSAIMLSYPDHEYTYAHRNDSCLLSDIPKLQYQRHIACNTNDNLVEAEGSLWINTWYGQQDYKYMNKYGISFDTLYSALNDSCKQAFGKELDIYPKHLFPQINYDAFDACGNVHPWTLEHQNDPKILVENGNCLSGQSENFDMSQVVVKLAVRHPNIMFLVSTRIEDCPSNVFYCGDIIKKDGCDLNEISYLSTFCDMIIGRSSAITSFSMVQNNLFDRAIDILQFTNLTYPDQYWLNTLFNDKIKYTSTITTYRDTNLETVQRIIESYL